MIRSPPRVRWLAVAIVAGAILVGSTTPAGLAGPHRGPFGVLGLDKWLHGIAFAAFAVTLVFALLSTGLTQPLVVLAAVAVSVAYGAGIEVLQLAIPTRRLDTVDLLADAVGAVLATSALCLVDHGRRWFRGSPGGP